MVEVARRLPRGREPRGRGQLGTSAWHDAPSPVGLRLGHPTRMVDMRAINSAGECLPYKEEVTGSNPVSPTTHHEASADTRRGLLAYSVAQGRGVPVPGWRAGRGRPHCVLSSCLPSASSSAGLKLAAASEVCPQARAATWHWGGLG